MASYENKIYAAGGNIQLAAGDRSYITSMLNAQGTSESLAESFNLDPFIQVMDFSKPVSSSQNSIDISTDNITTDIRLPVYFDEGVLFISDGVMHMLLGGYKYTAPSKNTIWNFNLKTQKSEVQDSGIQYQPYRAAIAFDTEKQVGWYYGGQMWSNDDGISKYSQDLYRLDRGKGTPTKIEVNSSSAGSVVDGELVYLKNIGEAGILVLIGGSTAFQMVSMVDLINKLCHSCLLLD